jgi:hypothetical protein
MPLTHQEAQEITRQLGRTAQASGMHTLPRQRAIHPDYGGGFVIEQVARCLCRIEAEPFDAAGAGKNCRRGPAGGVCGNCGGAIPE